MPTKPEPESPFVTDDNDLWGEWGKMPKRTRDAAVRVADARHAHVQGKARLDVCRARLAFQIRKDPGKFDLPDNKVPSNDVVDAMVELQSEHQKAVRELNDLKYAVDIAEADVEAFLTMRKELENKVELLALQYHGEREPRPLSSNSRERINRNDRDSGGGVDVE